MQRKEEILAKKAKLAELRRQREEREQRQKESGKRESLAGEPSEVSCPYYSQSEISRLIRSRPELLPRLGPLIRKSLTASSTP